MSYKDQPRYPTTVLTIRPHDLELFREALEIMYDETLTLEQRDHINHWLQRLTRSAKILTRKAEHQHNQMVLGSAHHADE